MDTEDRGVVKIFWARQWHNPVEGEKDIVVVEPAPSPDVMLDQLQFHPPFLFTEVYDAVDNVEAMRIGEEKIKLEYERWLNKKTKNTQSA